MKKLVDYLNTLHRINGNNINTTAESAHNSDYSSKILYKDQDFIDEIKKSLSNAGKVLLTGFAGDGKTTIAKFVADDLYVGDFDFSQKILELETSIGKLVIIKDLSELSQEEATKLLYDKILSDSESLLIVSNTGTIRSRLLEMYDSFGRIQDLYGSKSDFETCILNAIECGASTGCFIDNLNVKVFNLVKRDNLGSITFFVGWNK